jgi:hypothetical protein
MGRNAVHHDITFESKIPFCVKVSEKVLYFTMIPSVQTDSTHEHDGLEPDSSRLSGTNTNDIPIKHFISS